MSRSARSGRPGTHPRTRRRRASTTGVALSDPICVSQNVHRGRTGRVLTWGRCICSTRTPFPTSYVSHRDAWPIVYTANVLTSVVVACELRYSAAKRASRRLTRQVEAVFGALTIRSLESDVDRIYAAIRVALEKKGALDRRPRLADCRARASNRRGLRHRRSRRVQPSAGAEGGELGAIASASARRAAPIGSNSRLGPRDGSFRIKDLDLVDQNSASKTS